MTDLAARLRVVSTSHVCDALAHIGYSNFVMQGLRPLIEPGLVIEENVRAHHRHLLPRPCVGGNLEQVRERVVLRIVVDDVDCAGWCATGNGCRDRRSEQRIRAPRRQHGTSD